MKRISSVERLDPRWSEELSQVQDFFRQKGIKISKKQASTLLYEDFKTTYNGFKGFKL